jgi:hypothetical protein
MLDRIANKLSILLVTTAACSSGSRASSAQTRGEFGDAAALPETTVTVGFAQGRLREEQSVGALRISKHPVTLRELKDCVEAGACSEPTGSCANWAARDEDAAVCPGFENAKTYCEWVGGRLPTLAEWLYAARGTAVRRFPWGDERPTCDQHPGGWPEPSAEQVEQSEYNGATSCGLGPSRLMRIAEHSEGASPSGVEDILMSSGELVGGRRGERFGACSNPERACLVYGLSAGAIDSVEPAPSPLDAEAGSRSVRSARPHTFRCVAVEEG